MIMMRANFDPMLELLAERGIISKEKVSEYRDILWNSKDEESYTMVRDFVIESYYSAKAHENIFTADGTRTT